jgi:hypothetical protein
MPDTFFFPFRPQVVQHATTPNSARMPAAPAAVAAAAPPRNTPRIRIQYNQSAVSFAKVDAVQLIHVHLR